jgi:MSHA biogenesis protein MshL
VGRRQGRADVRVTSGSIQSPTGATPGAGGATGQPVAAAAPAGGATQAQSLESSRITTTSDNDFWRDLQASLQSIVGTTEGRGVILNAQAGVAVVRGFPTDLRNAEQFLRTMQVIVERQVMLEAKIIEVLLSDGYQTGINWAAFRTSGNSRFSIGQVTPGSTVRVDGLQSTPTGRAPDGTILPGSLLLANPATSSPQNPDPLVGVGVGAITSIMQAGTNAPGSIFGLALQTSNFAALLNFLETQGTVHVLSSPRIATLNNQKAVLKVGTDEFFVTNVTTTTSSTGSTSTSSPTITVQPFFSGIALDVTPQIADNGEIILHVHPSVSSVTDKTKTLNLGSLGTITLPLASSSINESDTIVRVSDGSIVAIGGLMRQAQNDSRSGVPGLGEAPVLGNLFRSSSRSAQKSELVILLKTTVIHGDASWQAQAQEVNDRVQGMQRPAPRKE